ncbi:LUD domain-containing protein [uncultured Corynebacterium sp.]|uniref:LutC/YkgG family protein n=1 Tax=uncultured Corynebacterium sp. TaxID=159447 RepID=UPI0025F9AA11|nr:LUD domain-containing protein [uncultured Corynebacterium sp.]
MAPQQGSAKEEILARINSALGSSPKESPVASTPPRAYRREGVKQGEELRALLIDRLEDYDATVTLVKESELAGAIRDLVAGGRSTSGSLQFENNGDAQEGADASRDDVIIAPAAVPDAWFSGVEREGYTVLRDAQGAAANDGAEASSGAGKDSGAEENSGAAVASLTQDQINSAAAVVTGSAVTIADTGTIVLAGPESGRRMMTLLPDHHVVVVPESTIVELVPEATTLLQREGLHTEPMTFVSGPSATVDIELIRVHGVHGPRQLDVVIVTGL